MLSAGLLAYSAKAIVLNERAAPAVVSFDVERSIIEDPVGREQMRKKRDNTVGIDIVNPVRISTCVLFFFSFLANTLHSKILASTGSTAHSEPLNSQLLSPLTLAAVTPG